MPDDTANDEAKLRKLGQRLREGWARRHPIAQKSMDTIRQAVRDEYKREQELKRQRPPLPRRSKDKDRGPDRD